VLDGYLVYTFILHYYTQRDGKHTKIIIIIIIWNQAVHTDRQVTANRPHIIIKNKKEKICTLIYVAIPADRNVVHKEAEKKLKYKSIGIEMQ
jgi:hypothetical protein